MGIFGRFREAFSKALKEKEDEEAPPADVKLEYRDAGKWLDSQSEPLFGDVGAHVSRVSESMKEIKARLEKDVKRLGAAKPDAMQDRRLERAILNNQRALFSKLKVFLGDMEISGIEPSKSFEFFDGIKERMSFLMSDTAKNFYFVNTGFGDISEDIKRGLFELGKSIDEAIKYLEPMRSRIESTGESYKIIGEIEAEFRKRKELETEVGSEEKRLKGLTGSEKALREEIKGMEKGAEIRELEGLRKSHEAVLDEISALEARIVQAVSPVGRALKKYARVAQFSGREEERLLGLYIDDPARAVEDDNGLKLFKKIVPELELHISRGSISLKDKVRAKALSALSMLGGSELDEMKEKLADLKKKERAIKKDIDSDKAVQRMRELDEKYTKLSFEIESVKSRISELKNKIESADNNLECRIRALEKKMSAIGNYTVTISYPAEDKKNRVSEEPREKD